MIILCIIPARSGSKGIPNKNIKLFHDKPLLAWSINQAQQSKYDMRIIVFTDSQQYATIANNYGAETPFLRPSEISQDLSTDYQCIKHCLDWLKNNENYIPDIVLQLRPTQPLRKIETIDKCMYNIIDNQLIPLFMEINNIKEPYNQCRQVLPKTYLHNGYIDIFNTDIIHNNTISGLNIYPYIMNKNNVIDIDSNEDWIKAENSYV